MFGKFFESTFTGSMFGAGLNVFAVWGYVVASTDHDHRVELNPLLLAATLGCKAEEVEAAILYLASPDPRSRSKEYEGRRIVQEGQFQYFVPNHETYRNIRDDEGRKEYNRVAKQKQRERERSSNDVNMTVKPSRAMSAHTETETESDTESERKKG